MKKLFIFVLHNTKIHKHIITTTRVTTQNMKKTLIRTEVSGNQSSMPFGLFEDPAQQDRLVDAMEKQARTIDNIMWFAGTFLGTTLLWVGLFFLLGFHQCKDGHNEGGDRNNDRHPKVLVLPFGKSDKGVL